jgi:hypothetical protein
VQSAKSKKKIKSQKKIQKEKAKSPQALKNKLKKS